MSELSVQQNVCLTPSRSTPHSGTKTLKVVFLWFTTYYPEKWMTVLAVDNQTNNLICLTQYVLDKCSYLVGGWVGSLLR